MIGKKKDKKPNPKNVPFRTCGKVIRTKKMPNGMIVQEYCPLNANIPHGH